MPEVSGDRGECKRAVRVRALAPLNARLGFGRPPGGDSGCGIAGAGASKRAIGFQRPQMRSRRRWLETLLSISTTAMAALHSGVAVLRCLGSCGLDVKEGSGLIARRGS